ncbi:hypothetical protein LTR56_004220 [Elasticomyces elasticus]|nr:hypothetical protein LTR56_004220 [Elasticomyces elasticus]KAK3655109.1 hypothetical protein LTR22_010419 [Elasticomyces elasticus]KAK4907694.1 hypothetical protein LTR49_023290 [Elasticomyces elasticus]KAK5750558.1 hypothetical protein LTS12_019348 [Elasticomyces elasticus]
MPHHIPWRVQVLNHTGSSDQDIRDEPAWTGAHQHRVEVRNRQDRLPGLTHDEDGGELPNSSSNADATTEEAFDAEARQEFEQLKKRHEQGGLINFREIISGEKDFHFEYPQNRSLGWRYVLDSTDDSVKNEQKWPANLARRKNHGAVPRILRENRELDVENGKLRLSMDDLKNNFEAINIPVSLACDGNRRKELNMIKKSNGSNWGAGTTACVYWKGQLLRDVLLAAGIE